MALSGNEKCSMMIHLMIILFNTASCTAESLNLIELTYLFRDKISPV